MTASEDQKVLVDSARRPARRPTRRPAARGARTAGAALVDRSALRATDQRATHGASALTPTELDGSLTIVVDASSQATLASVGRLDLTRPVDRALRALNLVHRFALVPARLDPAGARPLRIGGIWRIDEADPGRRAAATEFDSFAAPGHVKVSWEIDVAAGEQHTLLSIRTRFTTTDEAANARLLDAWALVGPLTDTLTARAAHSIKAYTEDLEDGEEPGWP